MTELEVLKTVAQTPKILHEVYGDLAKPGVRHVGKALGTILGLGNTILWPLALQNERSRIALETNLERYRRKMENLSEEQICEVAPEVGVPVVEKLAYVTNQELSEMYVELLAKASQTQEANAAHPSFANIINSLSPDEAIVIRSIRRASSIPYVSVRLYEKGRSAWIELQPMVLNLPCSSDLTYPNNVPAYISNLEGLGVLDIQDMFSIDKDELYAPVEEMARKMHLDIPEKLSDREIKFDRGKIDITSFGRLFLQACLPSH